MKKKSLLSLTVSAAALLATVTPATAVDRGYNYNALDEASIAKFNEMKQSGAKLIRLAFSRFPLAEYDLASDRVTFNGDNVGLLLNCISYAQKTQTKVIVDPHRVFGSRNPFTLSGRSDFFTEPKYGKAWARMWRELAKITNRYNGVIWGLEVLNEPGTLDFRTRLKEDTGINYLRVDVPSVFRDCVRAIRQEDRKHRLIIMHFPEDFRDNVAKDPTFYPKSDDPGGQDKIYYSTHMYWPLKFTHQGIQNREKGIVWETNNGKDNYMTEENLLKQLGWMEDWLERTQWNGSSIANNKVFVGEWGISQGNNLAWNGDTKNPSNGGREWLKSVYTVIRKYHWTIHAYNGKSIEFDVTRPNKRFNFVKEMLKNTSPNNLP